MCGAMDDKVFSIKGSAIGANLPPLHPFCRCSVAAYEDDEDDFAAWLDSIDPDGAGEEEEAAKYFYKRQPTYERVPATRKEMLQVTKEFRRRVGDISTKRIKYFCKWVYRGI